MSVGLNLGSLHLQGSNSEPSKAKDSPERVRKAAQQFESLMIAQMMKSIRENEGTGFGEEDPASDTALGMAEESFADALSRSGGFGLARVVEAGLDPARTAPKGVGIQKGASYQKLQE